MKQKSKFLVFVLSFIPGFSHLYLGIRDRALIFFLMFFGTIFGVAGISAIANTDDFFAVLLFLLPLVWFVGLVDAISLCDKRNNPSRVSGGEESSPSLSTKEVSGINNQKLITIGLSIIPGAGHMYLGLQKKGLELMTIFFFTAYLMGYLNMSLFFFALPVIWFYSLFDAYHNVEENRNEKWGEEISIFTWFQERPRWVGWGLIFIGIAVILERMIAPYINYEIRHLFQTGIVALILILSGIRVLKGSKISKEEETVEEEAKEGQEPCTKEE